MTFVLGCGGIEGYHEIIMDLTGIQDTVVFPRLAVVEAIGKANRRTKPDVCKIYKTTHVIPNTRLQ